MWTLEVSQDYSGNYVFTVSDGFNKGSFELPSYQVNDYQIDQACQNVHSAYDVDSAITQAKQAFGIY